MLGKNELQNNVQYCLSLNSKTTILLNQSLRMCFFHPMISSNNHKNIKRVIVQLTVISKLVEGGFLSSTFFSDQMLIIKYVCNQYSLPLAFI